MNTLIGFLFVIALAALLPASIRAMKRWLRGSRSGGVVGSFGAGLAAALDPAAAMIVTENEKREAAKGDEDKEGSDEEPS